MTQPFKPQELWVLFTGNSLRFLVTTQEQKDKYEKILTTSLEALLENPPYNLIKVTIATATFLIDCRTFIGWVYQDQVVNDKSERILNLQEELLRKGIKRIDPDRDEPWKQNQED